MAKYRQPITSLIPGGITALLILLFSGGAFIALLSLGSWSDSLTELTQPYFRHILLFTLEQALLSTLLSISLALVVAGAFSRAKFIGKALLLRLYTVIVVLPAIIVVLGILAIYGREGWLAQLSSLLHLHFELNLYGWFGILFAHTFYNFPLALRLFLQLLDNIPVEQRQLAHQLNFNQWQYFRWVSWPAVKKGFLPSISLIFILCFSSFAIVLILGGGPKHSTLEVAIYQAIRNFNLNTAAVLSLIQIGCCLLFSLISQKLTHSLPIGVALRCHSWSATYSNKLIQLCDTLLIVGSALFLLPPLFAILYNGWHYISVSFLMQPLLWHAIFTSGQVALGASLLSVTLTLNLLWSARALMFRQHHLAERTLLISGLIILVIPSITLASGLFLLLQRSIGIPHSVLFIVISCNALMAIPFNLKMLTPPFYNNALRYEQLCQSLNIKGLNRAYQIELKALRRPIGLALAFSAILSIGDFGIISILGNNQFVTLPLYLYQLMGSYQQNNAAATGALLLLLCLGLFILIERLAYDD